MAEIWMADYPDATPRRSFRWAHNLTCENVAERWNEFEPGEPTMTKSRIYQFEVWPAPGGRRPTARNLRILARIYKTHPRALITDDEYALYDAATQAEIQQAEICGDHITLHSATATPSTGRETGSITGLFAESSTSFPPDSKKVVDAVSALHQELSRTLANTSTTDGTDDHWRTVADSYGHTYRTTPPLAFLCNIGGDLAELHRLLERPLFTRQRRGLYHSAARMAGLLATTLINLGKHRQARAWFHTAIQASQESEDRPLQAWVLVRYAVSALYWGDPRGSIHLTQQAIDLIDKTPCVAAIWAPAVLARALSQIGDREAAYAAISSAEAAFDQLHTQINEQHSYGYTAAQLHFYRSNTLTNTGDFSAAYEAQSLALQLYKLNEFIDPSLIRIDHALCLAREGRPDEAARCTADLISGLPSEHRSPIIVTRTLEIWAAIPARYQQAPEVEYFRQSLELPPTDGGTD